MTAVHGVFVVYVQSPFFTNTANSACYDGVLDTYRRSQRVWVECVIVKIVWLLISFQTS